MGIIKVVMDSGKVYQHHDIVDVDWFIHKYLENDAGVLKDYLVNIDDVLINPRHISSIEIIEF